MYEGIPQACQSWWTDLLWDKDSSRAGPTLCSSSHLRELPWLCSPKEPVLAIYFWCQKMCLLKKALRSSEDFSMPSEMLLLQKRFCMHRGIYIFLFFVLFQEAKSHEFNSSLMFSSPFIPGLLLHRVSTIFVGQSQLRKKKYQHVRFLKRQWLTMRKCKEQRNLVPYLALAFISSDLEHVT